MFRVPLVESTRGGPGGRAVPTDLRRDVLAHYRAFEAVAAAGGGARMQSLRALLGMFDRETGDFVPAICVDTFSAMTAAVPNGIAVSIHTARAWTFSARMSPELRTPGLWWTALFRPPEPPRLFRRPPTPPG